MQVVAHSSDPGTLRAQWQTVFCVAAGVHIAGAVFYAACAQARVQDWACAADYDRPQRTGRPLSTAVYVATYLQLGVPSSRGQCTAHEQGWCLGVSFTFASWCFGLCSSMHSWVEPVVCLPPSNSCAPRSRVGVDSHSAMTVTLRALVFVRLHSHVCAMLSAGSGCPSEAFLEQYFSDAEVIRTEALLAHGRRSSA